MKGKKRWIVMILLGVIGLLFIATIDTAKETVIYNVPEGFQGCMSIYYSEKGHPPLEMKDHVIVIDIPKDGKILTSTSAEEFNKIGWHKTEAYYVNDEGGKLREIPNSLYANGVTSWSGGDPGSAIFSQSFDGRSDPCY